MFVLYRVVGVGPTFYVAVSSCTEGWAQPRDLAFPTYVLSTRRDIEH